VASICRRLDGIPLAIELAAARTRALTAQQLDTRLGDRFRRLAVFAGGCTLEAAEEVCANDDDDLDVLLLIAALVDRSLLVHEAVQGRYRMLETIRQFAWDKLVEASEDQALRTRNRDWCLALADAAEFATPAATAWLARLAAEQDNFRAALEWDGPTGDDGAKRLRLGGALREFWWAQAQPGEGRHWLERALRAAPAAPSAARATALLGAGLLAGEQGDAASALAFFRQAMPCTRSWGTATASPRRWSAWARPPWCRDATSRRGRCLSKRCRRLGPREANTWPRSRSTSLAMGSICKATGPRHGRSSNKPGKASSRSVTLLGATELPREASPAPQLGVREAGIAGVTAALDPDSLSALWNKAKAMTLDQAIDYALQQL
jgi:hypothetical protein